MSRVEPQLREYFDAGVERITVEDVIAQAQVQQNRLEPLRQRRSLKPAWAAVGAVAVTMMAGALVLRRTLVQKIPRDLPMDQRIARYQAATLIGLESIESAGILVISLALVSGATSWILAGGGAAALLMMTARPSEAEIGLD